ncbi:bleomycin hydrolase [Pseudonaja textilis]|uniref:bleomycin hydrolase n=1 Tax=Pseudonaja textilis TaxID=8673 RepID=UPI000EAA5646|nr:bleomycin hydrolase [Pseudonaja textilis]
MCVSGLSLKKSGAFLKALKGEPRYRLAQNVATSTDFLDGSLDRDVLQNTLQVFQHAVPAEGKPVTNQKNSGKPLQMREYCLRLRNMVETGCSKEELSAAVDTMIEEVFRVVSICLGSPPTTFCWEYYDKEKNYHKIGPISPAKFYQEHVKPLFDMESKVCLVNDPRPRNKYNQLYTVDYLGNMVGGRKTLYNNQPVELLKKMVAASIQDGEEEPDEGYEKWRVENSWGEDRGNKGYLLMTDEWFSEFVYEVVTDRKHVPEEVLEVLQQEPIRLPAWDPMGALAH